MLQIPQLCLQMWFNSFVVMSLKGGGTSQKNVCYLIGLLVRRVCWVATLGHIAIDAINFFLNLRYWKIWRHKTVWCHYYLGNANHNKPIHQFLHLNALLPFGLCTVPSMKGGNCLCFGSFCFQVMWLTKYGHDYQKWWQPQIEETWPKTNPRTQGSSRYEG